MIEHLLLDTLVTGLPLLPMFLGIYLVLRIREDFDLTVEGSFTLGGAVCAVTINAGWPPLASTAAAIAAGVLAGTLTSAITTFLRLPVLMSGLVMNMALFSVTLRVLGQPSLNVAGDTVFAWGSGSDPSTCLILAVFVLAVFAVFGWFLTTQLGLALRASGLNERMVRSQGVSDRAMLLLSLTAANGLAGLSGALMVQMQGFADVNMGSGMFVAGVGAVLLGVLLVRPTGSRVVRICLAVAVGGILYRFILTAALRLGLPAGDLKAVTALTLVIAVAAQAYVTPVLNRYDPRQRRRVAPSQPLPTSTLERSSHV